MSLLSTIADKWPEEIEKMFKVKEVNFIGCYAIRLVINGHYTDMVIDDYVPYDKHKNKLIYARKVTKNIWPILLEKAFAKFNGSYEDIVSGTFKEIKFFLPYPTKSHLHNLDESQKGKQWNRIKMKLSNH